MFRRGLGGGDLDPAHAERPDPREERLGQDPALCRLSVGPQARQVAQVGHDFGRREGRARYGLPRRPLLDVEPAHGRLQGSQIAGAPVAGESPVALPLDALVSAGISRGATRGRLVESHGRGDVVGREAYALQDERHDALVGVLRVGAPGHPAMLPAHGSARLVHRRLEGGAGVAVAIAPGVADEPPEQARPFAENTLVSIAARASSDIDQPPQQPAPKPRSRPQ